MSEEVSGALPTLISLMVSVDVKPHVLLPFIGVSRCGLAVRYGARLVSRRTSVRSASALLSLQELWFMDTVL